MAYELQFALYQLKHVPAVPGAASIGGGIASGAEIAGSVGGIAGGAVAVVGLFLTIAANNAKRRHEYDREMREAEERGESRAQQRLQPSLERAERDMEFWRNLAMEDRAAGPIPLPPSQVPPPQRPPSERRRRSRTGPGDEEGAVT